MSAPPRATEAERAALLERLRRGRVRLIPKPASRLMRLLALLLRPLGNRDFAERYWTTLGSTIYHPGHVRDPLAHPEVIAHELIHVEQWRRWGPLLWISYLLLPLPIGLAWFRWRWEREAYEAGLRRHPAPAEEIERVVQALWQGYAWPWPRSWMRAWFRRRLEAAGDPAGDAPAPFPGERRAPALNASHAMRQHAAPGSSLLALLVLSFIWGYSWVMTKIALNDSGPFVFAALRTLGGVLCLLAVLLWQRRPLRPPPLGPTVALGLLQTTGFLLFSTWALVEGGAGKTAVLVFTMPFWTLVLAWPLLGERIRGTQWIAVACALAGLLLVLEPWGLRSSLLSKLLAVLTGVSWAGAAILAKRLQGRVHVDLLSLTFWQMVLGLIPIILVAVAVPSRPIEWSTPFVVSLAYNGVLTTAVGWVLWLRILRALPAGTASMSALAIPVIALLTSSAQLGEVPRGGELTGIFLIAAALLLISLRAIRDRQAVDPSIGPK